MKNPIPRFIQRIKQPLQRKPNRFVVHLEQQAQLLVLGTDALRDYMKKPNKKNTSRVSTLEKEGDEVRRIFIDELNRTFVTPIDREDLFSLSRSLDDVLDLAESAMREMDALNAMPNDSLRAMAELLYNSTQEILLAIQRLEKNPDVTSQHVMRIKKLENDMESHYTSALAVLFNSDPKNMGDLMTRLKLREIYQYMLYAMRGAERVSDTISHVVVKLY
jgi:uncharacterized protein